MHGRISSGPGVAVGATILAIALGGPLSAAPPRTIVGHHPWHGTTGPPRWPVEVLVTDRSDRVAFRRLEHGGTWDFDFEDGSRLHVRAAHFRRGPGALDATVTTSEGHRFGPVAILDHGVLNGLRAWRTDLDADGRDEYVVVRWIGGTGSVRVEGATLALIDPPPTPDGPVHVQRLEALGPTPDDLADLDGDGRPELLLKDMVTGEASQCRDGRRHNFFSWRPYVLLDGRWIDASAEHDGYPWLIWYTSRPQGQRTTMIRPEALDEVLSRPWMNRNPPPPLAPVDLGTVLTRHGASGSMVIRPRGHWSSWSHGGRDRDRRTSPDASFGPVLADVLLRTGRLGSIDDAVVEEAAPASRRTVREALDASDDEAFAVLAARLDRSRWIAALEGLGYGNADLDPGPGGRDAPAPRFWRDGSLRLSPREQVMVLEGLAIGPGGPLLLWEGARPGGGTIEVHGILDRGDHASGGWHVGWVRRGDGDGRTWPVATFAGRLSYASGTDASARRRLVLECLRACGVLPADAHDSR